EIKNQDDTFTLLEGEQLNQYIENIDTKRVTIKFAPKAAGNVFKVTVKALTTEEGYDLGDTRFTAYLTVVEGFNVYNEKQLSVFNNYTNTKFDWADLKEEFGLEGVTTSTIILQNDIVITKDDIPQSFFWKKGDANFS